jgi:hypothetical protein
MYALQPLLDSTLIDGLYADPYIARVGHDDRPAARIDHPAVSYIGAYLDGNLLGAFLLIESGFVEVDVHALLTRDALQHSRIFGEMLLTRAFNDSQIARVTAYVIDGLTEARNYCLKLGFKTEGYRRDACRKDGALVGLHVLGITRTDWENTQ